MSYFPIYLRNAIIHPSLLYPKEYICIQFVVTLQSVGLAAMLPALFVAIDSEWRYAELYPRLDLAHCTMKLIYQVVDILASPCSPICAAALLEPFVIGELSTFYRIRIEIVIDMQTINIVACKYIPYDAAYMVTVRLQCRIEIQLSLILYELIWVLHARMLKCQQLCGLGTGTIGINPCMKFHITLMTLINHECQRVPPRRTSLLAGEVSAPRFVR